METVVEKNVLRPKSYVVEIDGKIASAYGIFVEAVENWSGIEAEVSAYPNQGPRSRPWSHRALNVGQSGRMAMILLMP